MKKKKGTSIKKQTSKGELDLAKIASLIINISDMPSEFSGTVLKQRKPKMKLERKLSNGIEIRHLSNEELLNDETLLEQYIKSWEVGLEEQDIKIG